MKKEGLWLYLLLSRLPVFSWGLAGVGFEVLPKSELLGEAQFISHLFDQNIRLAQEVFRLIDSDHIDPLHRRITGALFDDVRKMPRRKTLFVGIVLYSAMLAVLLIEGQ